MTYSKKLRIITKEVYIVLKKQAFMIIGMLLLTSLLVGCRMEMSRSEWCNRYGFAEDEVFDIEIGNYGFPYIDTEINGHQIKMMYDTGNMVGISVTSEVAKQLGLTKIDGIMQTRVDTGGLFLGKLNVFASAKVNVFGWEITPEMIYETFSNGIDGLLPPSLLLDYRVTIDYKNKFMGISKNSFPEKHMKKETFPLIVNPLQPGLPVIAGEVNGEQVLIMLDTGCSRTCVDEELINKLSLPANEWGYEIREVRLGSFKFPINNAKKVSYAGINRGYPGPIMLCLGSDIISKVVFTVDYPNEKVILSE